MLRFRWQAGRLTQTKSVNCRNFCTCSCYVPNSEITDLLAYLRAGCTLYGQVPYCRDRVLLQNDLSLSLSSPNPTRVSGLVNVPIHGGRRMAQQHQTREGGKCTKASRQESTQHPWAGCASMSHEEPLNPLVYTPHGVLGVFKHSVVVRIQVPRNL